VKTFFATQLFDGHALSDNMHIQVLDGYITAIKPASESDAPADVELNGLVSAGFVDVQVNGGGGALFNDHPDHNTLKTMVKGHTRYGTTAMLPTLITDSHAKMEQAANAVAQAISQDTPGIAGIHFEGPYLSHGKKGIHPAQHVRPIKDSELSIITRKDTGSVLLTLAPENVSPDVIADLVKQGIVVSLGHSNADIDTVLAAIEAGAHCFTHLFNAMSGLSARSPGMISAALSENSVSAGLIVDFHHVHKQNCKLAYQCLGPDRLMLVTDSMAHTGSDLQILKWQKSLITRQGDKLTLEDGSIAGSCIDMATSVRNMHQVISSSHESSTQAICDALKMASATPARVAKLADRGTLSVGARADFVVLTDTFEVQTCWIGGAQVYSENDSNT
jgi:N-acetylglucosamine-6-phosphate deacetylase